MLDPVSPPVVVTGATGRVGGEVVSLLARAGHRVRPTSRRPGDTVHGVPAATLDWDRPDTWSPAIDGAAALLIVIPERPGALAEPLARCLAALERHPRRVVLLSALGAGEEGDTTGVVDLESALRSIAAEPVVLRPNTYMQNLVTGFLAGPLVRRGELVAPVGDTPVSLLDVRDLAQVAVEALTGDIGPDRVLTLTGPEALTFADVADRLAAVTGRPVVHVDPGEDGMRSMLAGAGLPAPVVDLVLSFFAGIRTGRHSVVTADVESVLRRPATSVATFAADHAPAWRHAADGADGAALMDAGVDGRDTMVA